jgi:hypothetical protein
MKDTGCCPPFDPKPWDGKTKKFKDKLFLKDHVACFLHIPLNFGKVMVRDMALIEKAGAKNPEHIMLTDESLWGMDIYIAVDKEVPGAKMVRLSGDFLTKVFEGPYKDAGKWAKEMAVYVKSKGKELKKLYFSYTTCPACAKAYGKNYVVLFAQV